MTTIYETPLSTARFITRSDRPGYGIIQIMDGLFLPCRVSGNAATPIDVAVMPGMPTLLIHFSAQASAWRYLESIQKVKPEWESAVEQ